MQSIYEFIVYYDLGNIFSKLNEIKKTEMKDFTKILIGVQLQKKYTCLHI